MDQPPSIQKLGKIFLIIDNMFVVIGFYIVFPLISIYFIEQQQWEALLVGTALGLRQFIQQGLGIFGGACADKLGAKPMIVFGMLIRAFGLSIMSISETPYLLCASCILAALGGTLFDPPRTALVLQFIPLKKRNRFYTLLMLEDSICAIIGTLLGTWLLLQYNFKLVCLCGSLVFLIAAIFNAIKFPICYIHYHHIPILQNIQTVLNNKKFVIYVLTLTGYYILSIQVMLMFPIQINNISGHPETIKWIYIIECILSLILFFPITSWGEKSCNSEKRLMIGLGIMLISLFTIGFIDNLYILFCSISCFYIGTIIAEPARETLISILLTNNKEKNSYMGFSKLGLALGGIIGYSGSGWLYDFSKQLNIPELPWFILSIIGLITLLGLYYQFNKI
ncbi:multidrug efflux MFS transporter MdtH [Blochmannia endosymbiont of Polyrhachis (Hedomyrma) turneri]|uniref:multidrug efflux MFS transporter MdtH n=1 Tax=Blochmannia endosymbiont of Polyrhachis (Hedomyrma) turneri TaxID=1505596 RepID=UPI00061A8772|nr:multidrug efflux MFS transporter MdtH [Blochmannia endosymbiont of Polyrhachis (Hedomyrma) turneri]AKC60020.1 multidrug resistance protein mdtH [Blochmannia endosymbiont of Polyrhachis (Hedomyrma) turneri]